jgi:hypothetical protein
MRPFRTSFLLVGNDPHRWTIPLANAPDADAASRGANDGGLGCSWRREDIRGAAAPTTITQHMPRQGLNQSTG